MWINLNCNVLNTDEYYFYFDIQLLRKLHGHCKKAYEKRHYLGLEDARSYLRSIDDKKDLLYAPNNPKWSYFESEFEFEYHLPEGKKVSFNGTSDPYGEESIIAELKKEMEQNYPNE